MRLRVSYFPQTGPQQAGASTPPLRSKPGRSQTRQRPRRWQHLWQPHANGRHRGEPTRTASGPAAPGLGSKPGRRSRRSRAAGRSGGARAGAGRASRGDPDEPQRNRWQRLCMRQHFEAPTAGAEQQAGAAEQAEAEQQAGAEAAGQGAARRSRSAGATHGGGAAGLQARPKGEDGRSCSSRSSRSKAQRPAGAAQRFGATQRAPSTARRGAALGAQASGAGSTARGSACTCRTGRSLAAGRGRTTGRGGGNRRGAAQHPGAPNKFARAVEATASTAREARGCRRHQDTTIHGTNSFVKRDPVGLHANWPVNRGLGVQSMACYRRPDLRFLNQRPPFRQGTQSPRPAVLVLPTLMFQGRRFGESAAASNQPDSLKADC